MRSLLNHVVRLLTEPNIKLLPHRFQYIIQEWENSRSRGEDAADNIHLQDCIAGLARLEQMHLNLLTTFVSDRVLYNIKVKEATKAFAPYENRSSVLHVGSHSAESDGEVPGEFGDASLDDMDEADDEETGHLVGHHSQSQSQSHAQAPIAQHEYEEHGDEAVIMDYSAFLKEHLVEE